MVSILLQSNLLSLIVFFLVFLIKITLLAVLFRLKSVSHTLVFSYRKKHISCGITPPLIHFKGRQKQAGGSERRRYGKHKS